MCHAQQQPRYSVHTDSIACAYRIGSDGMGSDLLPPHGEVLEDVGACLKHLKVEDAGDGLENIMRSRSVFVAEVEDAARWTIKALGQGAADLLQVPQKSPPLPSPTLPPNAPHSRSSCCRCPKRTLLIGLLSKARLLGSVLATPALPRIDSLLEPVLQPMRSPCGTTQAPLAWTPGSDRKLGLLSPGTSSSNLGPGTFSSKP